MIFNKAAVSTLLLSVGGAAAFAPRLSSSFVRATVTSGPVSAAFVPSVHAGGCACAACSIRTHAAACTCSLCVRASTMLFSTATEDDAPVEVAAAVEDVPVEVEALDGIESSEEAHNSERPARKAISKKAPSRGKPLTEFSVGDSVKAKVKSITSYGAFLDIGASTDGLLHISQLSIDFVADVNEVLTAGQEIDVRITNIDEAKGQVGLSLLSAEDEEKANEAAKSSRAPRAGGNSGRRDDSGLMNQLVEKGWSTEKFVEGTVVSTVAFGAFVRVDASQLAEGVEGEFDGLVHISALSAGRVADVTSVVSVNEKVQVRVKAIADRKVSLSMVSVADEAARMEQMGTTQVNMGAKDWKESLSKMTEDMPVFNNRPEVVDTRK
mmetsp:Transcript_16296/g.21320  ORF Transcript_16296/g.21320 Transcript_16296/m.21320 type:complete len:381 (+) Transcript_16296:89-1231(+)|eukprot:CAMPEP_0198149728 /NCGR_PEP_ID=MMETSP1443-20131203/47939_1 /TAXON_ID=186043 /ORGANISM="Entomoneis sp., Strain CCMP2396" /LENGTH=380 /DNA_ID=CAMNT_0043814845 /DNA_START=10 /DNA_END=1152 /DNA_ORIENTATION=-